MPEERRLRNRKKKLARLVRLERTTYGLEGRCSIRMSYRRACRPLRPFIALHDYVRNTLSHNPHGPVYQQSPIVAIERGA